MGRQVTGAWPGKVQLLPSLSASAAPLQTGSQGLERIHHGRIHKNVPDLWRSGDSSWEKLTNTDMAKTAGERE